MRKLPARPPVWRALQKHQRVCFVIGARTHRFAFFNETGTGKTFLSIALMRYFKSEGRTKHNLVLVPNKVNKDEWAEEGFDKHAPGMSYVVLRGSSENKWRLIEDNPKADAFIETYAGLVRMVCDLKVVKRKGKPKRNKLTPDRKRVARLKAFFDGVYCDESTYLKNRAKLPYRVVNQIAKVSKAFFILTATPFGRNPEDLWAQMMMVDGGETLGETLGLFRAAYYTATTNRWGGVDYKLKPEGKRMISRALDNRSISYPANEADLPRLLRIPRYASLGEDAEAYYERAKAQIIAGQNNYQEMKNAFLRMRQISSGFLGYRDDDTGERARFEFERKPKLELLHSVLGELGDRHKTIIFHEFQYTASVIQRLLDEMGFGYVTLNGKTKDAKAVRHAFKTDPDITHLVLSNSAGGYGLNLQNAKYGIYYESPVSAILRKQTEKRFDRQYSLHKSVTIFDLIVRHTVDQSILDFHAEGKSLWKAILNRGPEGIFLNSR